MQGYKTSTKVAGSRQKGKGKQCAHDERGRKRKQISDVEDVEEVEDEGSKRGRPRGAGNYAVGDVKVLLDLVERELPLGQRGWQSIHRSYVHWAHLHQRPVRTMKSLETKYKQVCCCSSHALPLLIMISQLVKHPKPTGDGYCPPEVLRAHGIEDKINERACTRDLNDSDFADGVTSDTGASNDDNDNDNHPASSHPSKFSAARHDADNDADTRPLKIRATVRHPDPSQTPAPARRNARSNGLELMTKLTDALDPRVQQERDEERANRSLQNTQFLSLSQQLRDTNATIENLRQQISNLQSRLHDADRARDRAELKLEMVELSHAPPPRRTRTCTRARRTSSTKRSLQHV